MKPETRARLLEINREFYQSFAAPFSETRQRLQPGVIRALEDISPDARVLDLGCGNGELGRHLNRHGHEGPYVGVDSSEELLREARSRSPTDRHRFLTLDLAEGDWAERLGDSFDLVGAFAVIHHLPGHDSRVAFLRSLHPLLLPEGSFWLSVWNFLSSPRLSKRIIPWAELDLAEHQLEEGDYLLDWRRGGYGLRYVHHFTEPALHELASAAGFEVREGFLSDGESGILGRYQRWGRVL